MIRLVLVDDHALVRAGMRATLATEFTVVGEAGTVADAVDLIVREKPDVVVCDVHLPDGTATDVIQGAVARGVTTVFLALSVSDAATDVISVIRAGARGYITKATEGDDLIRCGTPRGRRRCRVLALAGRIRARCLRHGAPGPGGRPRPRPAHRA